MGRSFREVKVWQRATDLAVEVYALTSELPQSERFGLVFQLRRAAVSVPSNIAEGHGRLHKAEFVHHLSISSGSLREIDTQVELVMRVGLIQPERCERVLTPADEVGRMLA